ncbi:MAG: DUF5615 family PIN-like protein [Chthoniobacterales bacterium]|nr:DUF5615 family PIN-like protein [Chthoniobacterales bacterium]
MKILLDECVPARLARSLSHHLVLAVPRRGWAGIGNGKLLGLAEKELDVLLTVDRKLAKQQRLTKFDIAVVLIRAPSNRLEDIRPLLPEILAALERTNAGTLTVVDGGDPR